MKIAQLMAALVFLLVLSKICDVGSSWRILRASNGEVYNPESQTFKPSFHDQGSQRNENRYSPPSDGHEIDPRYGVEKRLVPTGPNPLHH
eukprot:Gb_32525 [translate_table: standard]